MTASTYYWLATQARTGRIITDLPHFDVLNAKAAVGRYETTTGTLPITPEVRPPDWELAIEPNASHLILLRDNPDDPAHGVPIAGYRITGQERNEGDTISVDLATVESYLDSRYVGDRTFTNIGQNAIFNTLITTYVRDGIKPGIPIRVQFTTPGNGALRTRRFLDIEDKTVYSVFTDLAGVIGGPEWYIGWEWQSNPERITPVLYVGDRVGSAITPGFGAAATFEMPGPVTTFRHTRDYKQGRGANDVMATSSGTEDVRPQSPHRTDIDPNHPTVEFRFTPSTSITNIETLTGHADTALAALSRGSVSIEMTAAADYAPRLGVDWGLGDDVGYVIGGRTPTGDESVPAFPGGIAGTARVAGWDLTLGPTPVITPTLVAPMEVPR